MAGAARRESAVAVVAVLVMFAGAAAAAVYEVGDKAGWTIMGNPDYVAWARSKTFHLGDTVGRVMWTFIVRPPVHGDAGFPRFVAINRSDD